MRKAKNIIISVLMILPLIVVFGSYIISFGAEKRPDAFDWGYCVPEMSNNRADVHIFPNDKNEDLEIVLGLKFLAFFEQIDTTDFKSDQEVYFVYSAQENNFRYNIISLIDSNPIDNHINILTTMVIIDYMLYLLLIEFIDLIFEVLMFIPNMIKRRLQRW